MKVTMATSEKQYKLCIAALSGGGHVKCQVCETLYEYRFEEGILGSFEQCPVGSLLENRTAEDIIADLKR